MGCAPRRDRELRDGVEPVTVTRVKTTGPDESAWVMIDQFRRVTVQRVVQLHLRQTVPGPASVSRPPRTAGGDSQIRGQPGPEAQRVRQHPGPDGQEGTAPQTPHGEQ